MILKRYIVYIMQKILKLMQPITLDTAIDNLYSMGIMYCLKNFIY